MITFVGAGCGAVDLITVRGRELLEKADVIIYAGSLVNPELLTYAKADCELYNSACMTLEEIFAVMEKAHEEHKEVVRLHTGEPSIYGAVREQMDHLEKKGIPYENCPGVSACFGAAASLHLEYTLPGISQSLIITRMEGRTAVPKTESIESFAAHHASMAIYLSTGMLEELSRRLIAGGYESTTPAALVYKATWPEEEQYICTLADLAKVAREHQITKTALVLVGDVIAHTGYEKSRLYAADFETEYRRIASPIALGILYYTLDGEILAKKIQQAEEEWEGRVQLVDGRSDSAEDFLKECFRQKSAILFFSACGIAVRKIAPFVKDKLTDSPVLVADDRGQFVIPILSGHVGGANELAGKLALCLGATPVITTATDNHGLFAVDVFAGCNHLTIRNREGIAKISARLLRGEKVTMAVTTPDSDGPDEWEQMKKTCPEELELLSLPLRQTPDILIADRAEKENTGAPVLWLEPKRYVIGIGCRKGKETGELAGFVTKQCEKAGITLESVRAIVSIDLKAKEEALVTFTQQHRIPFVTYSAQELAQVSGNFTASSFVAEKTGVDNVCERSVMAYCGTEGRILLPKQTGDGMTIAIGYCPWKLEKWNESRDGRKK